ncbi:GNAT family N-acetyltransferase [Methylobacter sp.]|uniref:GNAT family N-acetyltransferase n=1 Tax=Methylobacter sp. TaxID=2051955 RepID=UPI002FDC8754
MTSPNYKIRTMSRDEINMAIDWAATEGWNPGLYDADCFYATDPEGFLVGELNNEPIATISSVKYGQTFGFVGFYIVKPEYRGQGYGIQIWNAGLERLSGRNVGLDGVVAQLDNYKKSGFELAYRNMRYEGLSGGGQTVNPEIIDLSHLSFDTVKAYDQPFFPDQRAQFLKPWLNQPKSIALGIMQKGKLSGYGVVRPCRSGYKIGPLFADSPELAEALFSVLKSRVEPEKPIYLDVSELNQDAVALAKKHNMHLVFETARMYTGAFPDLPLNRLFGVTTFELG